MSTGCAHGLMLIGVNIIAASRSVPSLERTLACFLEKGFFASDGANKFDIDIIGRFSTFMAEHDSNVGTALSLCRKLNCMIKNAM